MNWDTICKHISDSTNRSFTILNKKGVSGGSINEAYMLSDGQNAYFVKLNTPQQEEMFSAEAEGLVELANSKAIKSPTAICWGSDTSSSYIVMDFIDAGRGKPESQGLLGEQLASMHRCSADRFGWHRNNTIGSTPQHNTQSDCWIDFFRDHRLGFQLELAARNGFSGRLQKDGDKLLNNLEVFFEDYTPQPILLHGDLWSGNYFFTNNGMPVIFDPAVYYGDRETDLAMTELFGGFSSDFYSAYNETYQLDPNYSDRKTLYNLYHIINHVNLFGSGYLGQVQQMMSKLLSKVA